MQEWWAALNALALACCVVVAINYLLCQLTFVRRWLMGERSFSASLTMSLCLAFISLGSELFAPYFLSVVHNVRYLGTVIGGLFGGPLMGAATGLFTVLGRSVVHVAWPDAEVLVLVAVGLVAGWFGRRFGYRFTVLQAILASSAALVTDTVLDIWLEPGSPTGFTELWTQIANLVTILVVVHLFVNEREEEEHKALLERLALTDGLTHLANHRHFHTQLAKEIETARTRGAKVALVMLDIDYFKNYNDAFGHPEGDRLLTAIGDAIRQVVRSGDTGARYGGDEFALILPNADRDSAQAVAGRIQDLVARQARADGPGKLKSGVSLSAGIAVYPDSATDKDDLIRRADEALYTAKYTENRLEVYHSVFDDLKAQLDASELSLINTVKTLLTVINAKDRYTYGHSERVVNHCLMIARQLGLGEDPVKLLRIAAFLHDIGKIEIARDILNKAGALTPEERRVIEQHPVWGADIIQPVRSLRQVVPAVLHHHEWYDGSGYPQGLKGDAIPLSARILSVADAFDAMTTERPYEPAKTISEALSELKACAGTQFDPWVVDAFAAALLEVSGPSPRAAAAR